MWGGVEDPPAVRLVRCAARHDVRVSRGIGYAAQRIVVVRCGAHHSACCLRAGNGNVDKASVPGIAGWVSPAARIKRNVGAIVPIAETHVDDQLLGSSLGDRITDARSDFRVARKVECDWHKLVASRQPRHVDRIVIRGAGNACNPCSVAGQAWTRGIGSRRARATEGAQIIESGSVGKLVGEKVRVIELASGVEYCHQDSEAG